MVHGGLLAIRDNETHTDAMRDHGIGAIDLLVVNLYPFEETVRGGGAYEACIENIDIGGPAMIRAAAKNHQDVTVIVDPEDYANVLDSLQPIRARNSHCGKAGAKSLCAYGSL